MLRSSRVSQLADAATTAENATVLETNVTSPTHEAGHRGMSDAKHKLIQEKTRELEELMKIKTMSDQMVQYFEELGNSMQELSKGAQGVANTLTNWDYVFRTMSFMDTDDKQADKTLVKLPIVNNNNQPSKSS
ncbi:uncharacterized protein BYT42DRAFT_544424 [Radiomyces spectabilis]|uniref:uncharacterized protein n=1 Tax=Radiomyces spectabilis TaxID=64574 RepID=UPI00221F5A47|nr:uncharacterized protein BYT42DRAFT_544424 [Radiomyces spectabilis]KAI8384535.1 hypothetical protein BYT42DRAFT_544424 [Radiomyces spectabilis]